MGAMKGKIGWLILGVIVGFTFAVPVAGAADGGTGGWTAVPAYGTELEAIKDWQEAAIEKPAQDEDVSWFAGGDGGSVTPLAVNVETPILKTATLEKTSVQTIKAELAQKNANLKNKKSSPVVNTTTAGKTAVTTPAVSSLSSSGNTADNSATGGTDNMLSGLTGSGGMGSLGNLFNPDSNNRWAIDYITGYGYENEKDYSHADQPIPMTLRSGTGGLFINGGADVGRVDFSEEDGIDANTVIVGSMGKEVYRTHKDSPLSDALCNSRVGSFSNNAVGINGPAYQYRNGKQTVISSMTITADFDPCKPGLETKFYTPLVLDTDHSGAIALDGGVIQFDIAPHIAGLETIPVPAPGKDMFLVWDKAGTETIEGAEREYKEGEIIDITELFGPEDYSRSDFSKLAYTDDGFTKLHKLCDVDNDGDVDKQDTALSAEVAAKLKLWSPLSGELVLFKDTDIVIDIRAGSYERHPSDIEGWAVEYKMKDAQGRLLGYQWLSSKTSTPLCVDVLLAVQGE